MFALGGVASGRPSSSPAAHPRQLHSSRLPIFTPKQSKDETGLGEASVDGCGAATQTVADATAVQHAVSLSSPRRFNPAQSSSNAHTDRGPTHGTRFRLHFYVRKTPSSGWTGDGWTGWGRVRTLHSPPGPPRRTAPATPRCGWRTRSSPAARAAAWSRSSRPLTRGLHSFTFQLNLSRF